MQPIPNYWNCFAPPERAVALLMASASAGMTAYVPVSEVHAVFEDCCSGWADKREEAWQANWHVTKMEIEILEETIEVYLADQLWMTQVYNCTLTGGCLIDAPLCLQLDFYTSP